jgi:predicted SAM-dependent methyltransferase
MDVAPEVLYCFINGGMAPIYKRTDLEKGNLVSIDVREIAAAVLCGTGVEFGAGASPFPVPLGCRVRFGDAFTYENLKAVMYPGQRAHDLIYPDYVTDIKTLDGIPDESLDFIVACHVIEHTNNPLAAIGACHRALKRNGFLVLVVPDMTKTFDSKRTQTSLEHLIADYENPSSIRDFEHYIEFYSKAFAIPADAKLEEYADSKQAENGDIHYHSWTYNSFGEFINYCVARDGWTIDFSHDTIDGVENIEFYFVLQK